MVPARHVERSGTFQNIPETLLPDVPSITIHGNILRLQLNKDEPSSPRCSHPIPPSSLSWPWAPVLLKSLQMTLSHSLANSQVRPQFLLTVRSASSSRGGLCITAERGIPSRQMKSQQAPLPTDLRTVRVKRPPDFAPFPSANKWRGGPAPSPALACPVPGPGLSLHL